MRTRNQKGLSLVEVVLALGLLATVLISVAGLFVLSDRQLKSGRASTEALSVGRAIMEEMDGWGFHQTYQLFGYDGNATSYSVDSRTNTYASKWQATLNQSLGQSTSHAIIDIQSLGPTGVAVPNLDATHAIRVIVTVHWTEGLRQRQNQLAAVRY